MAEIRVERKRNLLPWIIGLLLLALVVLVVSKTRSHPRTVDEDRGAAAADTLRDDTPPRLRQYAHGTDFGGLLEIKEAAAVLAA